MLTNNLKLKSKLFESPESSTPAITRAVSAGLLGRYSDAIALNEVQRMALSSLSALPHHWGISLISWFQSLTAINPRLFKKFRLEELITTRLEDYAQLQGNFPALTMGAGLGGAAAHLALCLGGPFLPQSFVMTIKGGSPDGDVRTYLNQSLDLAKKISHENPEILTIQHFDPVHDGWLTSRVNHLRLKLLDLPETYINFIRKRLIPGGAICFLDCGASWLRYRISSRCIFQVGGWGDIKSTEYLEGSPRLYDFCKAEGLKRCDWRLSEYPLETGPESEWGVEAGLGEALAEFCHREGFRFVHISLPEPHDFSRLAFFAMQKSLEKEGRQASGILIEMFSQFDATATLRSGLLPLWLVFNTWDSLTFLKSMCKYFPPSVPIFFSPLITFTNTPDLVPWKEWSDALHGLNWVNIGARPKRYPADLGALVNWSTPLRHWAATHTNPVKTFLEAEELSAIVDML